MKEGTNSYLERPGLAFFTIGSPSLKKAQIRQFVKDFDPFLAQPIIYFIFFPADLTAIKMRIKISFWPIKLFTDRQLFYKQLQPAAEERSSTTRAGLHCVPASCKNVSMQNDKFYNFN